MKTKNLRPLNTRTKDEQREIQRAGGKASGESRKKTKLLKERMQIILSDEAVAKRVTSRLKKYGLETETNADVLCGVIFLAAIINNDLKAAELVAKWSGEYVEEIKANIAVKESELSVAQLKKMAEDFAND